MNVQKIIVAIILSIMTTIAAATPPLIKHSKQLIVVTTQNWAASTGELRRYHRNTKQHGWQLVGKPVSVVIGKNGLAWGVNMHALKTAGPDKKEGDNKAPAGVFSIGPVFGFGHPAPRQLKLAYLPITTTTVCVDDSQSQYYSTIINSPPIAKTAWHSGEQMFRYGEYHWGLVVNYNNHHPVKNAGSCIFMHIWKGPSVGTAGCTAMALANIVTLIHWLKPADQPLLVQLPIKPYRQLEKNWQLPDLGL